MPGVNGDEKLDKLTKKIFISTIMFLMLAGGLAFVPAGPLRADTYSPPDESIPEPPASGDAKTRQEQEKAAASERRRKAEAERKERERALRESRRLAQEAAEARRREETDKIRAASEDMKNRMMASGRGFVENGRFQSAINTLQGFLDANPRSAEGWYWISRAHHALGEYDRAQTALNIALEIDPHYPLIAETPSGLEPRPLLTKQQKKEPRPSLSILPVKPPLPANLPLEPVVISFPFLAGEGLRYVPYPPEPRGTTASWMQDKRFNEISRWRFRVDRMGILSEPRTAVAWKGTRPYEVYFWTGAEWARARRKKKAAGASRYDDILYGARADIASLLEAEKFVWNDSDTPSLAACASLMRYIWMGEIDLKETARKHEASGTASDDISQTPSR
jgi:tetratricopeptide (TPR) repeat protein